MVKRASKAKTLKVTKKFTQLQEFSEGEARIEQQYGRKQQAISNKILEIIKIIIRKNQAYLLLTAFADPSWALPALE